MNIRRLNETLCRLLSEDESDYIQADINYQINAAINNVFDELLDYVKPLSENTLKEIAEKFGYKTYGEFNEDTALVIDVKGRPDISNQKILDFLNEQPEQYEYLQNYIQRIADDISEEIPEFTIRGRMGGYWGLSNLSDNITISEYGFDRLRQKVAEILNEGFELEFNADIYSVVDNSIPDLAKVMEEDIDCFAIKSDYLAKMQLISEKISEQEELINSLEFWNLD